MFKFKVDDSSQHRKETYHNGWGRKFVKTENVSTADTSRRDNYAGKNVVIIGG